MQNHYFVEERRLSKRPSLSSSNRFCRMPLGLGLLCLGLLTVCSPIAWAVPHATGISSHVIEDGDEVVIYGIGFVADPSRYTVMLVDRQGVVATGEVKRATDDSLTVVVHGGRGSDDAGVVIREGVTVPLVDSQPSVDVVARGISWFQGTGDRAVIEPVVVKPRDSTGEGSGDPDGPDVGGDRFSFIWPHGCSEITARVMIGGNDPFDPKARFELPFKAEAAESKAVLRDYWLGDISIHLTGQATSDVIAGSTAVADVLSSSFKVFGLTSRPFVGEGGETGIVVEGDRMSDAAGVFLVDLSCRYP